VRSLGRLDEFQRRPAQPLKVPRTASLVAALALVTSVVSPTPTPRQAVEVSVAAFLSDNKRCSGFTENRETIVELG
jgi:hypothetical protein